MTKPLYVVLPGTVDDPAAPSGGNRYDRAVCDRLSRTRDVHEIAISGTWPWPAAASYEALENGLSDMPDESLVLLDGLVACGVPEVIEPQARRLRLVVLVHLPLGDETPEEAAHLPLGDETPEEAAHLPLGDENPDGAANLTPGEGRVLRAAAAVVVTSQGAARRVIELHGIAPERVHVATPGVDPAPLAEGAPGALLCVAAVTRRKGQDVLAAALRTLDDLDWTCTCVGSTERGVPAGAPARMRFVGPRVGADLAASYASAGLLVLPSRAETYGMVVTEALARGIPVLATEVHGVPEAIGRAPDGTVPGLLVPPGDAEALAAALRRWLTDAGLRERLRAAARTRRGTLPDWDETVRRLAEVLDGVEEGER